MQCFKKGIAPACALELLFHLQKKLIKDSEVDAKKQRAQDRFVPTLENVWRWSLVLGQIRYIPGQSKTHLNVLIPVFFMITAVIPEFAVFFFHY